MALTSQIKSPATGSISTTPNTPDRAPYLAELAAWFWNDFEVPVTGKHLVAIIGAITAGIGLVAGVIAAGVL
jgi:hypothetical protein